jgi:lysylphosphatidylglycerol synthetase-like protein (DUF2156 family)
MTTTAQPPAPSPSPASAPADAAGPLRQGAGRAVRAGRGLLPQLARAPFTLGWIVVLWVLGAVTGSLLHGPGGQAGTDGEEAGTTSGIWDHVAVGIPTLREGHWWTPATASLFTADLLTYLGATVLLLLVGVVVERRWGSLRTAVVSLSLIVLGTAVGLGVVALADLVPSWSWAESLGDATAVSATPLAFGLLGAASADMSLLWRRRLRLGLLAVDVVMLLYGGQIEDVLRLAFTVVGILVGGLVLHRGPQHLTLRSSRQETRILVAVVVAASALGPIVCAFSDQMQGPLAVLQALYVGPDTDGGRSVADTAMALVPAVLVLVLAAGLRRGRRFAWWACILMHLTLAVLGVIFTVEVLDVAQDTGLSDLFVDQGASLTAFLVPLMVAPLIIVVLLALTWRSFQVRAPKGTYRQLAVIVGGTVVVAWAVYVVIGSIVEDQFSPVPTAAQLIVDYPLRLLPNGYGDFINPGFQPVGGVATFLVDWGSVIVWAIVLVGLVRTFVRAAVLRRDDDGVRARAILEQHGTTTLSYMTTWKGNSYWFSADGRTFVAYRVEGGVAITTGDPVGPPEQLEASTREFLNFCAEHGWIPALYSTTPRIKEICTGFGYESLQVAEETVLPLGSVAFAGKKFQDIRSAISRATKAGVDAEWITYPTASLAVRDQIKAISEEWVSDKALPEMGFTLGGVEELDDPAVRCLIAVDADRTVHAVTSWMPSYRDGKVIGYTLDFMRRRSTGDLKGLMEFLIGKAVLDLQAEGAEFLSLSGAPLAQAEPGTAQEANFVERVLEFIGRTMEPVYGFRSLLRFKAKFQPVYEPMYLCYPDTAALPRIGLGISHAYLPHLTVSQTMRMVGELT